MIELPDAVVWVLIGAAAGIALSVISVVAMIVWFAQHWRG